MAIRDWHPGQLVTFLVGVVVVEIILWLWADSLTGLRIIYDEADRARVAAEERLFFVICLLFLAVIGIALVVTWRWFGGQRSANRG